MISFVLSSYSKYSDFIPINKGDKFIISLNYKFYVTGIITFDKNKNYLRYYLSNNDSGTLPEQVVSNYEFTPQDDEYYVRFSSFSNNLEVKKEGTLTIKDELIILDRATDSNLNGKKLVTFGDSITSGYGLTGYNESGQLTDENNVVKTYGRLIANDLDLEYHNYGLSASGYSATGSGASDTSKRFYNLIDNYHPTADIVTVAYGTNDYGLAQSNNMPFGNISDNDTTSFCGCVRTCFTKLSSYYPNTLILILLPFQIYYQIAIRLGFLLLGLICPVQPNFQIYLYYLLLKKTL